MNAKRHIPGWSGRTLAAVCLIALAIGGCPEPGNDGGNADPTPAAFEIGYTDESTGTYSIVRGGEIMPLFTGGQGGSHIYATLRATGFPAKADGTADVLLVERVTATATGAVLHDFQQRVNLRPLAGGTFELRSRFVFLDALPEVIDGVQARLEFSLTSELDPSRTASVTQVVILDLRPE